MALRLESDELGAAARERDVGLYGFALRLKEFEGEPIEIVYWATECEH